MTIHPKRPREANMLAKFIVDMAAGEDEVIGSPLPETQKDPAAVSLGRKGGLKGGLARAQKLTATERADIAKMAAHSRWAKTRKQGEGMNDNFKKPLSRSDALVKTKGSPMPFLRFTKSGTPTKQYTWAREDFFADLPWQDKFSSKGGSKQTATIAIEVRMPDKEAVDREMEVDYVEERPENNKAPSVHLNYDAATRRDFESQDFSGRMVVVGKDAEGKYFLTVEKEDVEQQD